MDKFDRATHLADRIDLSRHGVIEAHAGTGKTYTIVKLILRILERASENGGFTHLREILLVTYTEKAAGELKKRIQDGISERVNELRRRGRDARNAVIIDHLEECLNNIHEALIGTIHSVCLRLLQTWPFETGVHFNTRNIDDFDGLRAALRESMRTDWLGEPEQRQITRDVKEREMMRAERERLRRLIEAMERCGIKLEHAQRKDHLRLICDLALKCSDDGRELDTSVLGGESLETLYNASSDASSDVKSQLLLTMICAAAKILAVRYRADKRQKGLISFNDMLELTDRAVNGGKRGSVDDPANSESGVMLKTLRARLKYGIIDEFQDTSAVQWSIFKKIFLDGGRALLYIVGDPKQSIYSFQNADINSYLAAKRAIISISGADAEYCLTDNYRSLPEMIAGYNAILCRGSGDDADWFLHDGISYPSSGGGGRCARAPERETPKNPLPVKAVQVVALGGGNDGENRRIMAEKTRIAIQKLRGVTVSIPDGLGYKELTLDYKDFAVIVETHAAADPFIDEFRTRSVPCVKYKMPGVFNSAMARDIIALLTAIQKRGERPRRAAALLTHFFNVSPDVLDPERDTEPCGDNRCIDIAPAIKCRTCAVRRPHARVQSSGGAGATFNYRTNNAPCAAHALAYWGFLAENQLWAQMFKSIAEMTRVRQRLVKLVNGERLLADLRQVSEYCVSYLYQRNSTLKQLTEHLERLYNKDEEADEDKNIHTLATEKSSVKILTMHASKGLEFPVVFVMNSESEAIRNGLSILTWTDTVDGERKRLFAPYLNKPKEETPFYGAAVTNCLREMRQERRRRFYVALTRPQALLFLPEREKDKDLAPRLNDLLRGGDPNIEYFDERNFDGIRRDKGRSHENDGEARISRLDIEIPKLTLREFAVNETSYSKLFRESGRHHTQGSDNIADIDNDHTNASFDDTAEDEIETLYKPSEYHDEDKDDEYHPDNYSDADIGSPDKNQPSPLRGGRKTGDALHKVFEEILKEDDVNAVINVNSTLDKIVVNHLNREGVLEGLSDDDRAAAVKLAASYVRSSLAVPYIIPGCDAPIILADLKKSDRVPEPEFLLSFKPHRVKGFIDLMFRVRSDEHADHPYKYYVLDWKSNILGDYNKGSVDKCCNENYLLQARIYTLALDKYLKWILGDKYDREKNLGGALYVFVRGFGHCQGVHENIWYRKPDIAGDEYFVKKLLL